MKSSLLFHHLTHSTRAQMNKTVLLVSSLVSSVYICPSVLTIQIWLTPQCDHRRVFPTNNVIMRTYWIIWRIAITPYDQTNVFTWLTSLKDFNSFCDRWTSQIVALYAYIDCENYLLSWIASLLLCITN